MDDRIPGTHDRSTVTKMERKTLTIALTRESAPLLLELVTKAAVAGPQARLLASLYEQVEVVAKSFADNET